MHGALGFILKLQRGARLQTCTTSLIDIKGDQMKPANRKMKTFARSVALAGAVLSCGGAVAAEWSDTSLTYSYGTKFHEPFAPARGTGPARDIGKNIVSLFTIGGYKYGSQFVAGDLLMSDSKDPGSGTTQGATEVYAVYRNTIEASKVSGKDQKMGFMKDWGGTFGFDVNTKNDGYGSKKRMFVIGPTIMFDVPGSLSASLLVLRESNAPNGTPTRYTYKTHPMLDLGGGFPLGGSGFSLEGHWMFIGSKGNDEGGAKTKAETNLTTALMYDLSSAVGSPKGKFRVGVAYQYWKNKFGNDYSGPAGDGAFAKTPMVKAEYHF
jgi:hypothetical protein